MSSHPITPTKRYLAAAFAAAVCVLAAALPATAVTPAKGVGTTTLSLDGAAARSMSASGVRFGAAAPAKLAARRATLGVTSATFAGAAVTLNHGGALTLRRRAAGRTRTLTLRGLRVALGRSPSVSALVGGKRRSVFRLTYSARALRSDRAAGSVALNGAAVRLTPSAAGLLRALLGLTARPSSTASLGSLRISVPARKTGGNQKTAPGGSGPDPGPGGGSQPGTGTDGPDRSGTGSQAVAQRAAGADASRGRRRHRRGDRHVARARFVRPVHQRRRVDHPF